MVLMCVVMWLGSVGAECEYHPNYQLACDSNVEPVTAHSQEDCCRICEGNAACVASVLCKPPLFTPIPGGAPLIELSVAGAR